MTKFSKKRYPETNAAMHRLVAAAIEAPADKSKQAWNLVLKGALMAIERGEYHESVHERFVGTCPAAYKDTHFRIRQALGLPDPKKGMPMRRGRIERKRDEATQRRKIETLTVITASV